MAITIAGCNECGAPRTPSEDGTEFVIVHEPTCPTNAEFLRQYRSGR